MGPDASAAGLRQMPTRALPGVTSENDQTAGLDGRGSGASETGSRDIACTIWSVAGVPAPRTLGSARREGMGHA
jgi:hypothetical protein